MLHLRDTGWILFLALLAGACGSGDADGSNENGDNSSGGAGTPTSGTSEAGGTAATGGQPNASGNVAIGGASGGGGMSGTGGSTATSGAGGRGGAPATGGAGGGGGKATGGGGSVGGAGGASMGMPPATVGACNALPAAGKWEQITPPGVATSDALALDPFTAGTLWLGADPNGGGTPGLGGLFKSTDCGATWKHVNTGTNGATVDGSHMWSLAIDPVDAGVIYAVGAYGPQGLWKSTDAGVNWVQLFPASSEFAKVVEYTFASNVSMDPHDHKHLVVGTHANCEAPYDPVCQAESSDAGATWKIVRIPNPTGGWVERTGPYAIDASSWIFATPGTGMFLTTDHGATWNNATPPGVNGAAGGEFTHHPLFASPLGHYYLPGAPSGLLRSNDGRSWSLLPGSPPGGELCVALGGGKIYMADFNSGTYHVAVESDAPQWSTFPAPFTVGAGKQGPIFLEYDEAHHILYSSNFTGGVWRVITP